MRLNVCVGREENAARTQLIPTGLHVGKPRAGRIAAIFQLPFVRSICAFTIDQDGKAEGILPAANFFCGKASPHPKAVPSQVFLTSLQTCAKIWLPHWE